MLSCLFLEEGTGHFCILSMKLCPLSIYVIRRCFLLLFLNNQQNKKWNEMFVDLFGLSIPSVSISYSFSVASVFSTSALWDTKIDQSIRVQFRGKTITEFFWRLTINTNFRNNSNSSITFSGDEEKEEEEVYRPIVCIWNYNGIDGIHRLVLPPV